MSIYRIVVEVPAHVADLDGLATAVADAAHNWEPDDRDGWDVDVSATRVPSAEDENPEDPAAAFAAAGPDGRTLQVCYEDGTLSAAVVDLPGCFATGTTWSELGESLREGIRLWLADDDSDEDARW